VDGKDTTRLEALAIGYDDAIERDFGTCRPGNPGPDFAIEPLPRGASGERDMTFDDGDKAS